jgi:hypothetical protein
MNHYLVSAFSFSVFIPAVIALIFFRKIDKSYFPFLYCLWIGALNEVLSFMLINQQVHTTANNNVYVGIESILLTLYFANKRIINKQQWMLAFFLLSAVWIAENFIFRSIFLNSTYFRIIYSMLIVFLSIHLVNRLFFEHKGSLLNHPDFILCICFIIYFTYKALLQAFVIYGVTRDYAFLRKIYDILYYVNLGVNLLYTFAVVCMPRKARFMLVSLSR